MAFFPKEDSGCLLEANHDGQAYTGGTCVSGYEYLFTELTVPSPLASTGFIIYFTYGIWHSVEASYAASAEAERNTDTGSDSCK